MKSDTALDKKMLFSSFKMSKDFLSISETQNKELLNYKNEFSFHRGLNTCTNGICHYHQSSKYLLTTEISKII